MHGLEYRAEYADHEASRAALSEFINTVHGLDLTRWEERIGWDPGFVPFSFFEGDQVVASTCIYTVPMLLQGKWERVAQISSVGTLERLRRRGLNAELTRRALQWARETGHRGTFLFSDDGATGFYARQGFVERAEWCTDFDVQSGGDPEWRTLHFDRDEDLIRRLVENRTAVSLELGARCPQLELFHLLYENAGELRYLEDLDLIAAVEVEGQTMVVYDLIAGEIPVWSIIEPRLVDPGVTRVRLKVTGDRLGLADHELAEDRSSRLHVIESEALFGEWPMIPSTAHA